MNKVYRLKRATPKMKYHHMISMMDFKRDLMEAQIPAAQDLEKSHYWWIMVRTRKTRKNPDGWKVVRDVMATKSEIARIFCEKYKDGSHRIKHLLSY